MQFFLTISLDEALALRKNCVAVVLTSGLLLRFL